LAAPMIASISSCRSPMSEQACGPPAPWNSLAPRALFSLRMKYGSTSFQPQPELPSACQRS
jgi:hypothetical protein